MRRRVEGYIGLRSLARLIKTGESTIVRAVNASEAEIDPPIERNGKLISVNEIPRIEGIVKSYKDRLSGKGSASQDESPMV